MASINFIMRLDNVINEMFVYSSFKYVYLRETLRFDISKSGVWRCGCRALTKEVLGSNLYSSKFSVGNMDVLRLSGQQKRPEVLKSTLTS